MADAGPEGAPAHAGLCDSGAGTSASSVSRRPPRTCPKREDLDFGSLLGEGAFARVFHAKDMRTGDEYAVKTIEKRQIQAQGRRDAILNEKRMLSCLEHPGIIHLQFAFQDEHALYFVLEHAKGGELATQITRMGVCELDFAKFYTAEIIVILVYLRLKRVAHRDLKPQNLLLTVDGHLKLVDFDAAMVVPENEEVEFKDTASSGQPQDGQPSFVGTSLYIPPEVLLSTARPQGAFALDIWALGCIIFQMLVGTAPFQADTEYLVFQRILQRDYEFPADFAHPAARELIDALLAAEPQERPGLGAEGLQELERHALFGGSCAAFSDLLQKRPPPRVARLQHQYRFEPVRSFNFSSNECTPEVGQNFLANQSSLMIPVKEKAIEECPNGCKNLSSDFLMAVESSSPCIVCNRVGSSASSSPLGTPPQHAVPHAPRRRGPPQVAPHVTPPPRVSRPLSASSTPARHSRLEWWVLADVGGKTTRQWLNELAQRQVLVSGEDVTICGSVIRRRFPCLRPKVLAITTLPRFLIFDAKGGKLLHNIDPRRTVSDVTPHRSQHRRPLKDKGPIQVVATSPVEFLLNTAWLSFRCCDMNLGTLEWVAKINAATGDPGSQHRSEISSVPAEQTRSYYSCCNDSPLESQ